MENAYFQINDVRYSGIILDEIGLWGDKEYHGEITPGEVVQLRADNERLTAENAALRHDSDLAQGELGLKAARIAEVMRQRDALVESMVWIVLQAKLLHGVGRSIVKDDIWTIKEHAEKAIKQVRP